MKIILCVAAIIILNKIKNYVIAIRLEEKDRRLREFFLR